MFRLTLVSLAIGILFQMCSFALGDDDNLTSQGKDESASSSSQTEPKNHSANPFDKPSQQRLYAQVLRKLRSMKLSDGGEVSEDDWFVVGGIVGNEANFNTFQGEQYVARRVVEFVDLNSNRCSWRVFSRESDASVAKEKVSSVTTRYERWKKAEHEKLLAQRRAQQRAAEAYKRYAKAYNSYRRSSGRSRRC